MSNGAQERGRLGELKTIKTRAGSSIQVLNTGEASRLVVTTDDTLGKLTVLVDGEFAEPGGTGGSSGEGVAENIVGDAVDAVKSGLAALAKLVTCKMETTTTVKLGPDGKVTSITTTTRCA